GDILAVEEDTAGRHFQLQAGEKVGERGLVLEVYPRTQPCEGDSPVHGPGVQELEAQAARKFPGCTAFAGAGRSVQGNNHERLRIRGTRSARIHVNRESLACAE